MAANHVAILRSSARMAQQQRELELGVVSHNQEIEVPNSNELSNQMSVISLSSSGDDEVNQEMNIGASSTRSAGPSRAKEASVRPMVTSLGQLISVADIDSYVDPDLQQEVVINRLEQKCLDMSKNLEAVMTHLTECCGEVTNASVSCLEALQESVDVTCDKVEEQLEALNNLICKCDELGTKISVAGSFCDEIKTLRKSVDTLDHLYKTRPQ